MSCINDGCGRLVENRDSGECASCGKARRKAENKQPKKTPDPINKLSSKMATALSAYADEKQRWIKGQKCAVYPTKDAVDIHHRKGRVGFADDWARENNIPLLVDKRYWLAVSREGHTEIETHPKWAKENGFSLDRLTEEKILPDNV